MRVALIVGALLCAAAAHADEMTERETGLAAAASVIASNQFLTECRTQAQTPMDQLMCAARAPNVDRGVDFFFRRRLAQIDQGKVAGKPPLKPTGFRQEVLDYLNTRRFAAQIYEKCMTRHADGDGPNGRFDVANAICTNERDDAIEGMRRFQAALGSADPLPALNR